MVQVYEPTDEEKRVNRRNTCLDKKSLMLATELCPVGSAEAADCNFILGHKFADTRKIDYLPGKGKNVCGLTGVKEGTLLESEEEVYLKHYCELDPTHEKCESDTTPTPTKSKAIQGVPMTETQKNDSGAIVVLSSISSMSCVCCVAIAAMTMMK